MSQRFAIEFLFVSKPIPATTTGGFHVHDVNHSIVVLGYYSIPFNRAGIEVVVGVYVGGTDDKDGRLFQQHDNSRR